MFGGVGPTPATWRVERGPREVLPVHWRERMAYLEAKRAAAGLSVSEMAEKLGVSVSTVRLYTGGRRGKAIGCELVQRWLSACGVELGPV